MEKPVHQETYKGHVINIYQDMDAQAPNEISDDNLFLVHYHRNCLIKNDKVITKDDVRAWYQGEKIEHTKRYHIFPVAAYIHSGVVLSLGSGRHFPDYQWDVSHVGLVLVSKKEWKTAKEAEKVAQMLIDEWNNYLSGNVYGFVIDEDGDSCWGFYGGQERGKWYVLDEARSSVDYLAVQEARAREAKTKAYITHHVPLSKRT